jgi:hypothetical protein
MSDTWTEADWNDVPDSFSDPSIDDFRILCSNGFVGDLSIGSAFRHKPGQFPDCFPHGPDRDAVCKMTLQRRVAASDSGTEVKS